MTKSTLEYELRIEDLNRLIAFREASALLARKLHKLRLAALQGAESAAKGE